MKKAYFLVTIDTECDKDPLWKIQKPLRFRSLLEGIPNRLTPFFQNLNLRPTYLLSPEVIRDTECCRILANTPDCELGTHLHGEFVEPMSDFSTDATDTPPCEYPPVVEKEKLTNLTQLFMERFGYPPKVFRAGRFGLSKNTLMYLNELGYTADSSVTPFRKLNFQSGIVNYWGAPNYSHHPQNFRLIEIPVSTSIPRLQNFPAPLLKIISNHLRIRKGLRRLGIPQEPVWVRPFRADPSHLLEASEEILKYWPVSRPAFINVMFHNVEVIPGASPYASTEDDVQVLFTSLKVLVEGLSKRFDLIPVTMAEFCDENRTNYHIPSRPLKFSQKN